MSDNVWSGCIQCKRSTKHTICGEESIESHPEDYRSQTRYLIVRCNGCLNVAFRKEFHDYEDYHEEYDGEIYHRIDSEVFPHVLFGHSPIQSREDISPLVRDIYQESIIAIQEKAYTLAGLGLRATIEAICNDKQIKGTNLERRINSMFKTGIISKSDADRLNAIRFMGNDAAHKIKKAGIQSILVALKIIEHVLLSVYILKNEADRYLEPTVSNIDEAVKVLKKALLNIDPNSIFTFAKWIGDSKRRFPNNAEDIEKQLIDRVKSKEFDEVVLVDSPEKNNDEKVQWYKLIEKPLDPSDLSDVRNAPF